mgnify:CR=1 FL=1
MCVLGGFQLCKVNYVPVFQRKTYMQSAFPCFYTSRPVTHQWCTFLTPWHGRSLFWQLVPRLHSSSLGYIMPSICAPTFINNTTIWQSTSSIFNQYTCNSGRMQLYILQIVSISTLKKRILHNLITIHNTVPFMLLIGKPGLYIYIKNLLHGIGR